ncbi:Golgi transport complex subunit 3, partial [Kickxella alabastrina]
PGAAAEAPMETVAQFLEWFGSIERQVAEGQDREANAYAAHLRQRTRQAGEMLGAAQDIGAMLQRMLAGCLAVHAQTAGVQRATSAVQAQRAGLQRLGAELQAHLDVYDALAPATQLLNAPGDAVCLDPGFLPALERAERAIAFIARHAAAKDSELFLMRFEQCRMRALTLIKIHALRVFKAAGRDAARDGATATALYVRFRRGAARVRPLLGALAARAAPGSVEEAMLHDVVAAFFGVRRACIRPHMAARLKAARAEHADADAAAVDVLRDWCALMMNLCADERRVFADFFGEALGGGALRACLDAAMVLFHDHVRPMIIREADVAVLAGLSLTLLTFRRPGGAEAGPEECGAQGLDAFYAVVDQILSDAQQRLAYKAQAFIAARIAAYRPTRRDAEALEQWAHLCARLRISDPACLAGVLSRAATTESLDGGGSDGGSDGGRGGLSTRSSSFADVAMAPAPASIADAAEAGDAAVGLAEDQLQTLRWVYPPVASCRWLARQIDGCLDENVQRGLVEEALGACRQSLLAHAARLVGSSGGAFAQGSRGARSDALLVEPELQAHFFVTYSLSTLDHLFE